MKTITLTCGARSDGWRSSDLYLARLSQALREIDDPRLRIEEWRGSDSGPEWIRRRVIFPMEMSRACRGPIHLLDQSYGDALLNFPGPAVATVADIAFWKARGRNPLRAHFRARIGKGLARARMLIAISQATARELENEIGIPAGKIRVIPFGVDPIFFQASAEVPDEIRPKVGNAPFLIHVGTLEERKGFLRFARAYALDRSLPKLVQVGGSPSPALMRQLSMLGLRERIVFLGPQPLAVLHSLYQRTEALVFPSEYEGYGVPPVEARVSGARIITTAMPSVVEALGVSPKLAKEGDSREWLAAVRASLNEDHPGAIDKNTAEQLSWRRAAKQTIEVYESSFF